MRPCRREEALEARPMPAHNETAPRARQPRSYGLGMNLHRVLEHMSALSTERALPQGIIDEGRIFFLGLFNSAGHQHDRVVQVVDGLQDHVGQPFENHPWSYVFNVSTFKEDGAGVTMTLVGVVSPRSDGSILVRDFIALPKGLRQMHQFVFRHTTDGTKIDVLKRDGGLSDEKDIAATSLYPLAIAILNTRGCRIDLKRAPGVINARRNRLGKSSIPAHYDVDASEYLSALRSSTGSAARNGTHASPIPHLRRAHERVLPNGSRIWIQSALINVRSEGDIAFVERRKGYRRD